MKAKKLFIILLLFFNPLLWGVADGDALAQDDPYRGGSADGHSMTANETYIAACVLPAYTNISAGGNADGYSMTANETYVAACVLPAYTNISAGGNADGASMNAPVSCYTVTPLPIGLLTFTVECDASALPKGKGVIVKWSTASEQNNSHFTIERSANLQGFQNLAGLDWDSISAIKGAGNSSATLYYEYIDTELTSQYSIPNTQYCYRLKQTDFNGKYEYFAPVSITNCGAFNLINIYPNPANDYIVYLLGSQEGGEVTVSLYDVLGREVFTKEETIGKGLFKEKIETSRFGGTSGNYLLRITNGNLEKTQKQFVVK